MELTLSIVKNTEWLADIQKALQELNQSKFPETSFHLHPLYRVGVGKEAKKTIQSLFGMNTLGRIFQFKKNLRKLPALLSLKAHLPSDCVIFFQEKRGRIIAASRKNQQVLKVGIYDQQYRLVDDEVSLMRKLGQTSFAPYVAQVLNEGWTSQKARWVITSFNDNSASLLMKSDPEIYLLRNLNQLILTPMAEFYKVMEPAKISLQDWVEKAEVRSEKHPRKDMIAKGLKILKKSANLQLVEGQLHFDLHAGNILIGAKGETTIIDWEVSTRGLVLVDILDFYRRFINKNKSAKNDFFKVLQNPESHLTSDLALFLEEINRWYLKFFSTDTNSLDAKAWFTLYAVERSLLYFEKWGENRLQDVKGLEYQVLSSN